MTSDRSVVLLGTPIDDVTMTEAVERIADMIADGRATGRVHQVATVNVDFVVNAAEDRDLLAIMRRTDLAIPDGMGIVWGARLLGVPIRERTSGVELVPALVERAASDDWRICLFGAAPGVAAQAADAPRRAVPRCRRRRPRGTIGRGRRDDGPRRARTDARRLDADVVGVALGNPKQERWIARHGAALGAPVFIGIGGTLDFLTGVTRRGAGLDAALGAGVGAPGRQRAATPRRPLRQGPRRLRAGHRAPGLAGTGVYAGGRAAHHARQRCSGGPAPRTHPRPNARRRGGRRCRLCASISAH